jgi:hypothetical protein
MFLIIHGANVVLFYSKKQFLRKIENRFCLYSKLEITWERGFRFGILGFEWSYFVFVGTHFKCYMRNYFVQKFI